MGWLGAVECGCCRWLLDTWISSCGQDCGDIYAVNLWPLLPSCRPLCGPNFLGAVAGIWEMAWGLCCISWWQLAGSTIHPLSFSHCLPLCLFTVAVLWLYKVVVTCWGGLVQDYYHLFDLLITQPPLEQALGNVQTKQFRLVELFKMASCRFISHFWIVGYFLHQGICFRYFVVWFPHMHLDRVKLKLRATSIPLLPYTFSIGSCLLGQLEALNTPFNWLPFSP